MLYFVFLTLRPFFNKFNILNLRINFKKFYFIFFFYPLFFQWTWTCFIFFPLSPFPPQPAISSCYYQSSLLKLKLKLRLKLKLKLKKKLKKKQRKQ